MTKLVKEYLKETGNTNFVNIPINGGYLQYIHWLEDKIQELSLGGVVAMLPTQQKCMDYARGNFGFDSTSLYQEDAFLSGCDYMREELERKIKGN